MSDDVGYRKPPRHSRWQKGQSGNPKGRAKGQRNLKTDLLAELRELIQISEGGVPRRITKQRALLKALVTRAIGGDAKSVAEILNLILRLVEPDQAAPTETATPLSASDQVIVDDFLARHGAKKDQSDEL
jgi:hypothetical protein